MLYLPKSQASNKIPTCTKIVGRKVGSRTKESKLAVKILHIYVVFGDFLLLKTNYHKIKLFRK